jgi:membrane protein YqaA with SNARE-associated domain
VEWIEGLGLYASAFVFCLVGGFIPIVNAEAYFATMGAISERTALVPLVVIGTLGQMTAKTSILLASRGAMRLPAARDSERVRRVLAKARAWRGPIEIFVFVSAVAGFPPFYLVSMLGGALDLSVTRFIVVGSIGRFIRFFSIAWAANAAAG